MLLEGDELTKLEKTQQRAGNKILLQLSKWSVEEPGRCLTRPEYNSKSGRRRQVKSPTRMADLGPLVVRCLEKRMSLTSEEPASQPCSLPPTQRRIG